MDPCRACISLIDIVASPGRRRFLLRRGPIVAFGAVRGVAVRRPRTAWPHGQRPGTYVPRARDRPLPAARSNACSEIDCVRNLLPRRIVAAAERRAQSIGLGADRVLVCADAMTEEAYLRALAWSLGTSYERFDRIARADCPLDDNQLIQAAAAGLLPLRERNEIVWIIAPRCLTARRLADPRQSRPGWLRSFRLTSSERLARFVAQHTQTALGRRAAGGLRRCAATLRGWAYRGSCLCASRRHVSRRCSGRHGRNIRHVVVHGVSGRGCVASL